jgi:hypothetical protein
MKKNLIVASLFLFGLGLGGASARAAASAQAPSITPEMAQCIASCQDAGGTRTACWDCCVRGICSLEE